MFRETKGRELPFIKNFLCIVEVNTFHALPGSPCCPVTPASSVFHCFGKCSLHLMACICDSAWDDSFGVAGAPVFTGAENGKCLRVYGHTVSCSQMDNEGGGKS